MPGQLLRFGLTGLINTLMDFGIFNILLFFTGAASSLAIGLINIVAIGMAAVNSYFLNQCFTFQTKTKSHFSQGLRFAAATIMGLFINTLVVIFATHNLHLFPYPNYIVLNLSKILGAILSASWNFLTYRFWVFQTAGSEASWGKQETVEGLTSIIIPAYNESQRLPARLEQLARILPSYFPVEIIIVDDGSSDNTWQLCEAIRHHYDCISCLSYFPNQGKGKAVRTGMKSARGEFLIFTDADSTFDIEHIKQVAECLHQGHSVVIASRLAAGLGRADGESIIRRLMGKAFNLMVQALVLPGIRDSQCGLKGFHYQAARPIFSRQRLNGFAFDVEVLALARALKIPIKELPLRVKDCPGSTVNRILTPLQMAVDIIYLKLAFFINEYRLPGGYQPLREAATIMTLFFAALALRLPWLWEIPRFIDELKEVRLSYLIFTGQALPLHNAAHDIGAMHNYILAFIFKLLGPGIYWPRLYVACCSALTVIVAYLLGRILFGRTAGLLASVFLMFNGMNILTSHMAWANCTTPFFFTLAMLSTILAEQKRNGWWLAAAGLLWAACLQTHSSVIIYIAIVSVYVARPSFRRYTGLNLKWYWLSAVLFLLGYANMIYFNLTSHGGSIRWLSNKGYALEQHLSLSSYLTNVLNMITQILRSLGSNYGSHEHLWQYLNHPTFLLAVLLLVFGISLAAKKGSPALLPVWIIAGTLIIMPLVNKRFVFYLATRYTMPVLICCMLLAGQAAAHIFRQMPQYLGDRKYLAPLSLSLVVLLAACQFIPYSYYCISHLGSNESNRMTLQALNLACEMARYDKRLILLDKSLPIENQPLPYLMSLVSQPYREVTFSSKSEMKSMAGENRELIAVLSESNYLKLKNRISSRAVNTLSCHIDFPAAQSGRERKIYVLQLKPNQKR